MGALDQLAACPPGHTLYPSRAVAVNAATLHGWAAPACGGIEPFQHGDHWHIGHHDRPTGDACKATAPGRPPRSEPSRRRRRR